MARQVFTRLVSDISGKEMDEKNPAVVEIRVKYRNKSGSEIAVIDALDSDGLSGSIKDLMKKGRGQKTRGRKPGTTRKKS